MLDYLENYLQIYDNLDNKIVYDFDLINGGIGDMIKFFLGLLDLCIIYNIKIHYFVNNIPIEKYLKLKFSKMYIKKEDVKTSPIETNNLKDFKFTDNSIFYSIKPNVFYGIYSDNILDKFNINEIFEFSEQVINKSNRFLYEQVNNNYISIHLRLGDKFLEIDENYIFCKEDVRYYNENNIFNIIEKNCDKKILFFCDNVSYKKKIKEKYNEIIITDYEIGHTTLFNTTDLQVLNSVCEFYIITNSEHVYAASTSGFSTVGSKFNKIPLTNIIY